MRRAIAFTGLILAAVVAVARIFQKPLYVAGDSYAFLVHAHASTATLFLLQAAMLAAFLGFAAAMVKQYAIPEESVLVLVASPAVITSLVQAGPQLPLGILVLAIIRLWSNNWAMLLLAILAPIIDPAGNIILLIVAATLLLRRAWVAGALGLSGLVATMSFFTLPAIQPKLFVEFGTLGGFSIFIVLLAIVGAFLWWSRKSYARILAASTGIFLGSLFPALELVVTVLLAGIAGYALYVLASREWALEGIRTTSILLVICGLLFAAANTGAQAVRAEPSADFLEAVQFLKGVHADEVLAPPELRDALVWHGVTVSSEDAWNTVSSGRNVDSIRSSLPRFIILHSTSEAENILFMIQNTDDFAYVRSGEYAVWEVRA